MEKGKGDVKVLRIPNLRNVNRLQESKTKVTDVVALHGFADAVSYWMHV